MADAVPQGPDGPISQHRYSQELLENEQFIADVIQNPITAVRAYGLYWNHEVNDKRLRLAREKVIEYAKKVFAETEIEDFLNCPTPEADSEFWNLYKI